MHLPLYFVSLREYDGLVTRQEDAAYECGTATRLPPELGAAPHPTTCRRAATPYRRNGGGWGKSTWRRRSSSASKRITRAARCRSARSTSGIQPTSSLSAAAVRGGRLTLRAP